MRVILTTSSWLVMLLDVRMVLLAIMIIGMLDVRSDGERALAQMAVIQLRRGGSTIYHEGATNHTMSAVRAAECFSKVMVALLGSPSSPLSSMDLILCRSEKKTGLRDEMIRTFHKS